MNKNALRRKLYEWEIFMMYKVIMLKMAIFLYQRKIT